MKKLFKTGRKTLAVIMAVLMVMSAWVWVAPMEASAAAGKYYVRVYYNLVDRGALDPFIGDTAVDYTGPTMTTASAGVTLYHKADNGTASGDPVATNYNMKSLMFDNDGTDGLTINNHIAFSSVGFPTEMQFFAKCGTSNYGEWYFTKITVAASSTATEHTLWEGKVGCQFGGNPWQGTINTSGFTSVRKGNGTWTTTSDASKWIYPYAKTFTWSPTTLSAMTCPKTASDAAATQKVSVTAKDQYGVQMFDPTWKVSGKVKTTGLTVNPTTSSGSTTINVSSAANILNTTNSQEGTVTATWSTPNSTGNTSKTSTIKFTVNDATYNATFTGHRNADGEVQNAHNTTAQYGVPPTPPVASDYSEGDYDFTFAGWSPSAETGISADTTYTAVYNQSDKILADYTAVDKAIADANAIKAEYGSEYELKFTYASRMALDAAEKAVVRELGRTDQDVVDGYAQAINAALDLKPNKFDVIFLNKDGALLLYDKDAEYKTSVTPPSFDENFVEKYYDSENHYTFTGWDTDDYDSVVDDLVINPVYEAQAHNFSKTDTVPSTCTQKGATKYICEECGYSYIDGETDYGDHVWEDDFRVPYDIYPTCTVAGQKSIHCKFCDAQKDITVIPAEGHQWGSQSVAVEATCGKIGIATRVCDECLVCEHTIIDALKHDYKTTHVDPTCTANGYDEHVCQRDNCGYSYRDNYTNKIDHIYPESGEIVQEKACGVTEILKYSCTECGHTKFENGETGAHDDVDSLSWVVVVPATCEGKGYQTKTCSQCGIVLKSEEIPALNHDYASEVVKATCTTKGYTKKTCQRDNCGDVIYTDETDALNHDWTSTRVEADCTHSAYIEHVCTNDSTHNYIEYIEGSTVVAHNYAEVEGTKKAATCEKDGSVEYKCSVCGATKEEILPKHGHKYPDTWTVEKAATNTENGIWTRKCANCGDVETLTIPAGGHKWDNGTQTEAPSCTETGKMVYKCTEHADCGVTLEVAIPVVQHNIAQRENPATCSNTGTVEAYCSVCKAVFSTEEIPVKAHNFEAQAAEAPTCTTAGYTPYKCSDCGFTYNVFDGAQATGHVSWTETARTPATCTADGSVSYKCDKCNATKTEILSKTGHSFVKNKAASTQATCKTLATDTYECSNKNCDTSYTIYVGELADHEWGETVTVAATPTSLGYNKKTCNICGIESYEILSATGDHVFDKETGRQDATCTADGWIEYGCSKHENCTEKSVVILAKLGHTATAVYTAPTCIAEGSSKAVCSRCTVTLSEVTVPAIGYHNFSGEGVKSDATCTNEGSITYTCLTENCNETKVEKIPAKGHDLSTTVKDATCTEKGSVVTVCSRCDYTSTTELAAKNHAWDSGKIESGNEATCTGTGTKTYTCSLCNGTKTEKIPAKGHTWGEWKKTDATTVADGYWKRTCTSCGDVETLTIPMGHNLVIDTENSEDSTCTEEGKTVYKCANHTDCGIGFEVILPLKQHTVKTEIKNATCKEDGYIKTYCTTEGCGEVLSNEATQKLAHVYVAQQAVAPTCTSSGYTPYKCACGASYNKYDETKPATKHELVEGLSTATCTNGGEMTVTCKNCTYSATVAVPALGHAYTEDTTKATSATCAAPATKTYVCSHNNCNSSYTVYDGEKSAEHKWGDWVVKEKATATSLGYQTAECSVCGQIKVETIPATGEHNFSVETSRTPATCTVSGSVTYKCSTHTDCRLTSTVTLPATGHTEALEYTPATCDGKGSTKLVCSVEGCDEVIDSKEIPALGHLYGNGTVKNATCKDEGSIAYKCTRENCTNEKTVTIPTNKNAHQYATVVTDSTCKVKGSVVTKCTLCDDEITNKELPLIEHKWNDGVETTKATCETEGKKTYTCTVCGDTKTETIAKLGHDWSEWTVVPSSNGEKGEVSRTCSRGCTDKVDIPAGGHELVAATQNTATCTAEGTIVYKCNKHNDCGISVEVKTDKLQHKLETKTVTTVTCDNDGKVVTGCTECKAELVTTIIPATGHSYSGKVTTPATCTAEGVMTYTCAHNASHTYTEAIAKIQHNYVAGTPVAATCTSSGYTPYACSCGSNYVIITSTANGHSYTEKVSSGADCTKGGTMILKCACGATMETEVPALAHAYEKISSKAATCAAPATETYECSVCKDTYVKVVSEKTTSHTWGAETVENATNTSLGYKTRTCETCGQVYFEIIPATGEHNFSVETSRTPATCTADGYIVYACSSHKGENACNLTSKVTIPATGHKEKLDYKAATCTENGYSKLICETCKETIGEEKVITAPGHIYGNGVITENATCTAEGNISYTCSCGDAKDAAIPVNDEAHKLVVTTTLSTCGSEGSVVVTCENGCNTKNETITIPALAHNWSNWKTDIAATNTTEGQLKRVCANDENHVEYVKIPAGGHTFNTDAPAAITDAANCKEQGTATYNCTAHANCGVTITVKTTYGEHSYKTDVVESCSSAGSVRTYCTACNKVVANIELGMAQHTYVTDKVVDPTCTSSGYTIKECSKCGDIYNEIGDAPVGHTIKMTESKATCTTGDTIVLTCEKCNTFRQEVTVPALGHDYTNIGTTDASCAAPATETYKCSRCEAFYTVSIGEKAEGHTYIDNWTEIKAATENSIGYKTRACTVCGQLEVATIEAKGEHQYATGELVDSKPATCTENGYEIRKCSVHKGAASCGKQETIIILATGHDEIRTTTKYADCDNAGSVTVTCGKCAYKATEAIPALGHLYGEGKVTAATCKTKGSIVYTCTRDDCNATHTTVIDIDANAHNLKVDIEQATCLAAGKVTVTCKNGCDYNEETAIPAKGHTFTGEEKVTAAATCTADGEKTVKCVNCNEVDTVVIAKLGHNMTADTAVAPTCTTSGYTPYSCKNEGCNHSYNVYDEAKPAKGHTWGEWSVVTPATQTTDGLKKRSCTCGEFEEQIIPAMKHEMKVTETVPSTCTAPGHITYKCNVAHDGVTCGYTLVVELPVAAHALSTTVNKATCTAPGSVETKCTAIGCTYSEEPIALDTVPHKEVLSVIPADCENAGCAVTNCEVCKSEIQRKEIAALGHNYDDRIDANVKIEKNASCIENGLKTVKCSRCDKSESFTIPALGHSYATVDTVAATCKEGAYTLEKCAGCDASYKNYTSEALAHSWNSGVETTKATCEANGVMTYTCTACGSTKTEPTLKLNHSWSEWKISIAPSATTEGLIARDCSGCDATETAVIPALGGITVYTVTFVYDGKVVQQQVNYGTSAVAPDASKAPDATYHYSYIWDNQFNNVTADITVTAQYSAVKHSFGSWITDTPATCTQTGERHRECSCGYTQTETVAKTGHSVVVLPGGKPATCSDKGYETVKCETCGYTENRVLDRLDHVFTYHESYEATCDTDGMIGHYHCARCGKNYKDRAGKNEIFNVVIAKKNHTYIIIEGSEPTCTQVGRTDYIHCTYCGYTCESVDIPALGHSDGDADGICDRCDGAFMSGNEVCTCNCHKTGFLNEFIYKIISFFWRLFGTNKICKCGKLHY